MYMDLEGNTIKMAITPKIKHNPYQNPSGFSAEIEKRILGRGRRVFQQTVLGQLDTQTQKN